ncbi:MAG: SulP family inorganic anion transporter [Pseudonocardia sp.]
MTRFRPDLPGWGRIVSGPNLRADVRASLVVFLVALPLSLGIALASGAPIMAGLIAAVVGGIVAGVLGGSALQVSGPAAGLTVVVAELIVRFGWQVTGLITAAAGLVQILFGLTRLARFAAAIPPAVVHGMLAGIGITIALAQLHIVLGGAPRTGAVDSLLQLPGQLGRLHEHAVVVGLVTIGLLLVWPRLPRRVRVVPGPLVAVLAATVLAALWLDVPRVELPGGLLNAITVPSLAVLPAGQWSGLVVGVLTVALIASVESLLSAVAVDRMHNGPRTNTGRELLGQGAANTVSGLAGGLPITGVIVRSSVNVDAGARTRASAVLHGVWIAVFAVAAIGVVELVPLAALAGLLVVVGVQLVKLSHIRTAHHHGELAIYLITVAGVLVLNLLEGVVIGLAVAGLLMVRRALSARIRLETPTEAAPTHRIEVTGMLSFLAIPALSKVLHRIPAGGQVEIDLVVDYLDHAAYDHLDTWTQRHRRTGGQVQINEPREPDATTHPRLPRRFATWSQWQAEQPDDSPATPMLAGVAAYHSQTAGLLRPTLSELNSGQKPSGLLLTCTDSRVMPNVITHSGPGDLLTVQNMGNLFAGTAVRAAVQYATTELQVPLIAVCGHSGCGSMRSLLDDDTSPTRNGALGDWLKAGAPSLTAHRNGHPVGRAALDEGYDQVEALSMVNVALQLDTLRDQGVDAELMGLFFHIPTARVLVLDQAEQRFEPLSSPLTGAQRAATADSIASQRRRFNRASASAS